MALVGVARAEALKVVLSAPAASDFGAAFYVNSNPTVLASGPDYVTVPVVEIDGYSEGSPFETYSTVTVWNDQEQLYFGGGSLSAFAAPNGSANSVRFSGGYSLDFGAPFDGGYNLAGPPIFTGSVADPVLAPGYFPSRCCDPGDGPAITISPATASQVATQISVDSAAVSKAYAGILFSNLVNGKNDATPVAEPGILAESFSTGAAVTLTSVGLALQGSGSSAPRGLSDMIGLYSNAGFAPGDLIATIADVPDQDISQQEVYTFGADIKLAANTRYWIGLSGIYGTVAWSYTDAPPGGIGVAGQYNTGGGAPNPGAPYLMQLTTAVPEPAAWALMLVGFGAIGGRLRSRRRTVRA